MAGRICIFRFAKNNVQRNFKIEAENSTAVQVVVRGDGVLSKQSLLGTLRFQQAALDGPAVNATLRERWPTSDLSNPVATSLSE